MLEISHAIFANIFNILDVKDIYKNYKKHLDIFCQFQTFFYLDNLHFLLDIGLFTYFL